MVMVYNAMVYKGNWSHKRSASHDSVIPHSLNKSQIISEKSLCTRITFDIKFVFAVVFAHAWLQIPNLHVQFFYGS